MNPEAMARFEVWPLRFLPDEQLATRNWESSPRGDRRGRNGRGKLHVIGAYRAGRSSRRNVQANENGVVTGVSERRAVVVGGIESSCAS